MDNKIRIFIFVVFGIVIFSFNVSALYYFQNPVPFTAFDNGATEVYAANTQQVSGWLIAYDFGVGSGSIYDPGLQQNVLDRGLNSYYQGTDTYDDSTIGLISFRDFCYNSSLLIESTNAQYVNFISPFSANNNPQIILYAAIPAPSGTTCVNGTIQPPELITPVQFNAYLGNFMNFPIAHSADLDGNGIKEFVAGSTMGPIAGIIVADISNNQFSDIGLCFYTVAGCPAPYTGLALADIDNSGNSAEVLASRGSTSLNQIEPYSYSTPGAAGFSLISPPGIMGIGLSFNSLINSYDSPAVVDDINGDGNKEIVKASSWFIVTPSLPQQTASITTKVDVFDSNGIVFSSFPVSFIRSFPYLTLPNSAPPSNIKSPYISLIPSTTNPNWKNIVLVSQGTYSNYFDAELRVIDPAGNTLTGWPMQITGNAELAPPVVGDMNNDGISEIILGGTDVNIQSAPNIYIFSNSGGILYSTSTITGTAPAYDLLNGRISLGDVNNDGLKDVVLGGNRAILDITGFWSSGDNNFPRSEQSLIGDINGDGVADTIYSIQNYVPSNMGNVPFSAVYAFDQTTRTLIPGFPIISDYQISSNSITLDDFTGTGSVNLAILETSNLPNPGLMRLRVFGPFGNANTIQWGQYQANAQNTGAV